MWHGHPARVGLFVSGGAVAAVAVSDTGRTPAPRYMNPRSSIADSLIRSFDHGGSHTSSTLAVRTSGSCSIFTSTSPGSEPATGHAGAVSVIFTDTASVSSTFTS